MRQIWHVERCMRQPSLFDPKNLLLGRVADPRGPKAEPSYLTLRYLTLVEATS